MPNIIYEFRLENKSDTSQRVKVFDINDAIASLSHNKDVVVSYAGVNETYLEACLVMHHARPVFAMITLWRLNGITADAFDWNIRFSHRVQIRTIATEPIHPQDESNKVHKNVIRYMGKWQMELLAYFELTIPAKEVIAISFFIVDQDQATTRISDRV